MSTELLPQSVFQPRRLGKAVGHLFPDCYSDGGQHGHLVRPAGRPSYGITEEDGLKLENYYSSDFIFITFHLPLNVIYFHKINLPPGLTCILKNLLSWNRPLNSSNV